MGDIPLYDENNDYIDEKHIQEFSNALAWDNDDDLRDLEEAGSVNQEISEQMESLESVDGAQLGAALSPTKRHRSIDKPYLITSKSDWYPIHNKMNKTKHTKPNKKAKRVADEFRASAAYTILRWPILLCILCWMAFLGAIYSIIRVYVALLEYFITWRGERKQLRDQLRLSRDYKEWIQNALALDHHLNLDKWSGNPKFSYYDYRTIKLTITKLRRLKDSQMDAELLVILQGCIKSNFAGIENRQLYSHRYYGTKNLVERYITLVVECINYIADSKKLDFHTKRRFFKIVLKNYGKTALCLSGGACFAYTHFGVIKALLDNDLLPNIISGTSGGGLIAALTCTRTDEELKKLLVPQLARKITACEDPWYVWIPRFWKTGARFDSIDWARKSNFFTKGSMTFQEAYKVTGRKLNISTVPADPHSPVILCNNITSPNCIIWSSLLASSAVPGILNPVVLMMKNPNNGEVIPFSLGNKWRDGSLRTDIPIDALNTYYNVNFSIVSQVNPHILLFFFAPKGTVGRPVAISRRYTNKHKFESFRGGFLGAALEQLLRLEITKWLKMIKNFDLLPHFLELDWLNIWLQRFSGSITIWPRNRIQDFWYILSDPTEERFEEMLMKGQRSMFPRLLFIKHRLSIERAIERGRKLTKLNNKEVSQASRSIVDGDGFNVSIYDEDDSDSSEDESFLRSDKLPVSRAFLGVSDDEVMGSSRTASPDIMSDDSGQE